MAFSHFLTHKLGPEGNMARQLTGERMYLKGLACVAVFLVVPLDTTAAADLDPRTASAYDRYIGAVEQPFVNRPAPMRS